MKNVVDWFEIYTTDFNRAKNFYTEVFQCNLTDIPMNNGNHSDMQYATFSGNSSANGADGALVKIKEANPGYGGTLVYFDTEDINSVLSRVERAGGKIMREKTSIGEFGYIALIEDSEGNMVGMHSSK